MRGARAIVIAALGSLVTAVGATAQSGSPAPALRVPPGFVGMMADGPIFDPHVNLGEQLGRMASSGVQRVRVAFTWGLAQPYRHWSDVPAPVRAEFTRGPGGIPTDFQTTDEIVGLAASHHLSLLPVVVYPPSWDAWPTGLHVRPVRDQPYADYLKALVHRYGPRGTFWSLHPALPRQPIRMWQVWNEPDVAYFWDTPNFARSYVELLRAAHRAIKQADPHATVVLGSLTGNSWRGLATVYKIHRARKLFDVVAENTYAPGPTGVIKVLTRVRHVMDRNGDSGKPLIDTEVGWPSALGKGTQLFGTETTELGQAKKLVALLPMLAAERRTLGLAGFYYYTWLSSDQSGSSSPFAFSGLLRYDSRTHRLYPKPAYAAFRRTVLALEGRH